MIAHRVRLRYSQARAHAMIAAVIGCASVVVFVGLGPTNRTVFGPLKWADFIYFYTLGDIARTRSSSVLFDFDARQARQTALVPESAENRFIPVYGPQAALIFAPFSLLPYFTAGVMWALFTVAVYAWAVWIAWRPARVALPDRTFVFAAAFGFPPFWQLLLHGQNTALVLAAFAGAWWALEAGCPVFAGMVLSLLTIKPQFGFVLAPVALIAGEWRLISGVVIGVAIQAAAVLAVFDASVFRTYAVMASHLPAFADALEPDAYKMHSLRALTHLLPEPADAWLWGALAIAISAATAWIWRRTPSWRLRFGALVLASVLVNPHVTIYDATVLALAFVWLGGWLLEQQVETTWYWQRVYWISMAFLLPTAAVVPVQLSPVLIAELFAKTVRAVRQRVAVA
jgi:hypothetical protein